MASRLERLLAWIDNLFGPDSGFTWKDGTFRWDYYTGWGPKMAIVSKDDQLTFLGNAFCVVHVYNNEQRDQLISRTTRRKMLDPGDRVFYGHKNAYRAYDLFDVKTSTTGGLEM